MCAVFEVGRGFQGGVFISTTNRTWKSSPTAMLREGRRSKPLGVRRGGLLCRQHSRRRRKRHAPGHVVRGNKKRPHPQARAQHQQLTRICLPVQGEELAEDPQLVREYAEDIYLRLLEIEASYLAEPDYMEGQEDINSKMRTILVDWLVEVHTKNGGRPETLFLSVSILDRYLSVRSVTRKKLQLLGVAAMFIASKFEETDPPQVHEFAYITDHTYTEKDIVEMELAVLAALDCRLTGPTPVHFLEMLQSINVCTAAQRSLAQYALELALLDLRSLRHTPSVLASAALLMSNEFFGRQPVWPTTMAQHSRCSEESLQACAADLRLLVDSAKTESFQAVRRKYQLDSHSAVAEL